MGTLIFRNRSRFHYHVNVHALLVSSSVLASLQLCAGQETKKKRHVNRKTETRKQHSTETKDSRKRDICTD